MHRSEVTIDLAALRRNARTLLRALDGAELWAVVKADGYGHGAVDVAAPRSARAQPRSASRLSPRDSSSAASSAPRASSSWAPPATATSGRRATPASSS